jgi:hypothetical protein
VRMTSSKRTIVRVETNTLSVTHPAGTSMDLWCAECAAVVPMITPEHAARLCDTGPRAIYRMVENGEAHFTEVDSCGVLVCVNSLPKR